MEKYESGLQKRTVIPLDCFKTGVFYLFDYWSKRFKNESVEKKKKKKDLLIWFLVIHTYMYIVVYFLEN